MRLKYIVWVVRSACEAIGMQYRDRKAAEDFQRRCDEAKKEAGHV